MKKTYLFIVLTALLIGACSKQEMEDLDFSTELSSVKSTEAMVILHQANLKTVYMPFYGYKAVGYVKVKNVAYQKQVTVRYSLDYEVTWKDVEATYFATLEDGNEIWYFETEAIHSTYHSYPPIEFAIRYRVNGQEYWDNNANENYVMHGGHGTQYVPDFLLGHETMVDGKVRIQRSYRGFYISFWGYVQNVAYDKEVNLVYTIDNWQTTNVLKGSYSAKNPGQPEVDIWYASERLPWYQIGVTEVEAAIVYRVNGQEHWDNNYKLNYHPVY